MSFLVEAFVRNDFHKVAGIDALAQDGLRSVYPLVSGNAEVHAYIAVAYADASVWQFQVLRARFWFPWAVLAEVSFRRIYQPDGTADTACSVQQLCIY